MPPTPSRLLIAQRLLRRARVLVYLGLIALIGYHTWRYDLIRIPPGGCSPLLVFDPGTRLIVDTRPGPLERGAAVLYQVDGEGVYLGRIGVPPASAPADIWRACEAGALWITKERGECPGKDSLILGPIPPSAVSGRVSGTLPW